MPLPPGVRVARRRSESDVRQEMLDKGALLLEFEPHEDASKEDIKSWKKLQKKGFLLHETGCLIPDSNHWFVNKGKPEGASCASKVLRGIDCDRRERKNHLGWPLREEFSHLCHNSNCCSPCHVVCEAVWKNKKRNYCGIDGTCDCGQEPKCILPYRPKKDQAKWVAENSPLVTYKSADLKRKAVELLPKFDFKILEPNHYAVQDLKRKNQQLRKKRGRKHEQQRRANAKRQKE